MCLYRFFWIPYIYVYISYFIFLSDLLHAVWQTLESIHVSTIDPVSIPYCIDSLIHKAEMETQMWHKHRAVKGEVETSGKSWETEIDMKDYLIP